MTGCTPPFISEGSPTPPPPDGQSPQPLKSPSLLQSTGVSPRRVYRKSAPARSKRNSRSDPALTGESAKKPTLVRRHTEDRVGKSMLMELMSNFWGYHSERNVGVDTAADAAAAADTEAEELRSAAEAEVAPKDNLVYRIQAADLSGLYEDLQASLDRLALEDEVDGNVRSAPSELRQPSTIYVSARDVSGHRLGGRGGGGSTAPKVYYAELRKLPSAQDREKAQAEARKLKDKGAYVVLVL